MSKKGKKERILFNDQLQTIQIYVVVNQNLSTSFGLKLRISLIGRPQCKDENTALTNLKHSNLRRNETKQKLNTDLF